MRTTMDSLAPVSTSLMRFPKVGLHVSVEARVVLDDLVHLVQGLVVVDVWADADPVLTGSPRRRPRRRGKAWPMLRSAVANAFNLLQVLAALRPKPASPRRPRCQAESASASRSRAP